MNASPPRRVLFVDHVRHILAGAEINLLELAAEASARGSWEIHAACDPDGPLHEILGSRGIPCHRHGFDARLGTLRIVGRRFPITQALRSLKALAEARRSFAAVVQRVHPSVVVSCTNKDHFAAWPACRAVRIPSVWWVNDVLSADFFPWAARRAFGLQARRGASRLVAVSDFARRALLRQNLAPESVVAIHNGIPLERYSRQPRGTLRAIVSARDDEPLVGAVGRFTPWKGQDFFLRLAENWCRSHPSGQFVLVGHAFNEDQPFEYALREFVRSRGLRERIHLVPFQRDVSGALSDLDLLVHTSTKPE
ncbi:MAG: glycosyltransferase family 4 protein, partial [Verrucomicrobiales bacterium]|nr:glycosyltransferase family 4 protein [Verrucomicrobiales bacterium]